jgi:tripartite-type tricarboxylate transporter receptor subunit TctC
MTAVPYPSAARAVNDVLGGTVEVAVSDAMAVTHVKADKLKAVAIASKNRASCLEGVPTLAEQGVPFDLPYSYGLLAPAKTPQAIIDLLNRELNVALKSEAVREQQKRDCQTAAPADNSPADFAKRLKYHHGRWGAMIRNAGIKLP